SRVADGLHGHGLDPSGSGLLRERVAAHLSAHQQLPTSADQIVVTAGAQQGLSLLAAAAGSASVAITACPTYPGLASAFPGRRKRLVPVPGDGSGGVDPAALARACRKAENGVVYVAPTGHNPTGSVMPLPRREAVIDAARSSGLLVIEDLSLADLVLDDDISVPPPLSALDDHVVAVGSTSKLLWAGLRVGWVRAPEPLRASLVRAKAAADLASSVPAQLLAAEILGRVDSGWLAQLRAALAIRRDSLAALLAERLPAWRVRRLPAAGLSLWVELPLGDADAFAHAAARYGVTVAPGRTMCSDGGHVNCVRISFAEQVDVLDLAVDRLAAAWEVHSEDLAATPMVAGR
ncbi:MAG: PLP-dependent aminotransferase family protein, partial [Acidimicrobiia bacterium]